MEIAIEIETLSMNEQRQLICDHCGEHFDGLEKVVLVQKDGTTAIYHENCYLEQ